MASSDDLTKQALVSARITELQNQQAEALRTGAVFAESLKLELQKHLELVQFLLKV